jgi:hypothetical protein
MWHDHDGLAAVQLQNGIIVTQEQPKGLSLRSHLLGYLNATRPDMKAGHSLVFG